MSGQLKWEDEKSKSGRTQKFYRARKRAVVSYRRFENKKGKKARINLRMDADLVEWAKAFAASQDLTMTALIVDYFKDLRHEYGGAPPSVEQI